MEKRHHYFVFFIAAIFSSILACIPINFNNKSFNFTFKLKVSQGETCQVFFDVGRVFNEKDSFIKPIQPNEWNNLSFSIPKNKSEFKNLKGLRIDPTNKKGNFTINNLNICLHEKEIDIEKKLKTLI